MEVVGLEQTTSSSQTAFCAQYVPCAVLAASCALAAAVRLLIRSFSFWTHSSQCALIAGMRVVVMSVPWSLAALDFFPCVAAC